MSPTELSPGELCPLSVGSPAPTNPTSSSNTNILLPPNLTQKQLGEGSEEKEKDRQEIQREKAGSRLTEK